MEVTVVSATARERKNQYKREWYTKNKDKVKAANQRYWQKKLTALAEQSGKGNDGKKD